jgi:hypothetical protein
MVKRFCLRLAREEVELESSAGVILKITVNELSGPDSEQYQDSIKDRLTVEVDDKGKMKVKEIKTFKGTYESLLKLTLRDDKGNLIPAETIRTYPASVQKGLFEIAQKLNGLNEEGQEAVKNDSAVQG